MQKIAIKLVFLVLLSCVMAPLANAQEVITTIRDINAIPESQIMTLEAGGEALTGDDITANIFNELSGTEVTVVAVIMSDPRNSGLANITEGRVDRVHMFVRDTASVSLGNEAMGIQVVDGAYDTNNLLDFSVGDVIKMTAGVGPFGTAMQLVPTSVEFLGTYQSQGLPDSILDPVVITTGDANMAVGEDGVQTNWSNLADLRNQFIRVEGAQIAVRNLSNPDRPDFYITSDDGSTVLNFYDTGIQFRNDRDDYAADFNLQVSQDNPFEPPPPGSVVDLQGFLVFQGGADQIGRSIPANGLLSVVPFERRGCDDEASGLRCDIVTLETPPVISGVTGPDFIPDGTAPVTITFVADPDPTRTISETSCSYFTSVNADTLSVSAMQSGDNLACEIPAQNDGDFVTYWTVATDSENARSRSDDGSYRTLANGITSIEDIQLTIDEGPGSSPFAGLTTDMSVTATVYSDPQSSELITLQDDTGLAGWSGIFMAESGTTLQRGDQIQINSADIFESFGVTTLGNVDYSVMSNGNPVDYKVVETTVLTNSSVAEAHEGMLIRFDNVEVGINPDSPSDFGEWSYATIGTMDTLRADDRSSSIASDFNASLAPGTELEFIQGIWWFSFGNYKLVPETSEDVRIRGVANEDEELPNAFKLEQNYPNPFNPTTTISYQIPTAGQVTIEVFDLLGRSVRTLVDGVVAAGDYTVEFDSANLPSGVYLYRLTAGERVDTKKMLLLK